MLDEETRSILIKPRWTDPIDLFIGDIVEYDMRDGGYSIIRQEKLLPEKEIQRIGNIPKGLERDSAVGKLRYSKDPTIKEVPKKLEQMFTKYRLIFGEANELSADDIFSVKRDAVFLKRYVPQTEFGEYIKFAEKHTYDVYFLLGQDELITNFSSRHKTYEIYYNTYSDDIAVKGIKNEKINEYHQDCILAAIKRYLRYLCTFDYEVTTKFVVKLIDDYKFFRLPIGYYREFNDTSSFKLQIEGKVYETESADASVLRYMDIRYNFNHILVPMLNMASLGIGNGTQSKTTR